ncbi:hypothetical protein AOC36_02230 [Erysipelothrix larvae]|uniref:Cytoplasmic protein n=1 Tax=Erysipelothrix larvae TaxID=1514105 RepID=A0A0X8GYN6_9FIRM|nr:metal-sensing transcriptional repressor [Erysipelothrix larvae]AMC92843.1 hypothetical protein AOC36_02230 [Erysipelothrix larvae]
MKCDTHIQTRLKKVSGQMNGILKMMEDQRDCEDIVTQLSAVRASVDKIIALITTQNLVDSIEETYNIELKDLESELALFIRSR